MLVVGVGEEGSGVGEKGREGGGGRGLTRLSLS